MASLYVTTNNARKALILLIIGVLIFLFIDTFIKVRDTIGPSATPTRRFYMNQDRKFADIAKYEIPGITLSTSTTPAYVRESIHPTFPDVAYVYKIEEPVEKLTSFENAQSTVTRLGFDPLDFFKASDNQFEWSISDETKKINYNKLSQVWSLETDFVNNVNAKARKTINQQLSNYSSKVKTLVATLGFNTLGLDDPIIDSKYVTRGVDGSFLQTTQQTEAQYVISSVYRNLRFADLKPSDQQPQLNPGEQRPPAIDAPVYSGDSRYGQFNIISSNDLNNNTRDVFQFDFTNFVYQDKSAYTIITPDEAWTLVQQGGGSLVSLIPQNVNYYEPYITFEVRRFTADARETELGFYEPKEWTGFTYPVYVFKGRAELSDGRLANFVYLMDAIKRL